VLLLVKPPVPKRRITQVSEYTNKSATISRGSICGSIIDAFISRYFSATFMKEQGEGSLEIHRQVRDIYKAYHNRKLRPETALEIASDFVLDLINVFGEELSDKTPLIEGWHQFAPFEFILGLNNVLAKYKQEGLEALEDSQRAMLADNGVLLGTLINMALTTHADSFPDEEHFQIPHAVAVELRALAGSS
jgi:hypothetical protein